MKISRCLGIIWGLFMIYQDLNNYFLYGLLLVSSPSTVSCNNFLKYYTLFSILTTIISGVFYPVSGWLIDYFSKKTINFLILTIIFQFIVFILQLGSILMVYFNIYWFDYHGWILLCIFYQIFQILTIQNNNLLWKIIKQKTEEDKNYNEVLLLNDNYNSLFIVNTIGNTGDLTSDTIESSCLIGLSMILLYLKNSFINLKFLLFFLFCAISIINITSLVIFLIIKNDLKFDKIFIEENKKVSLKIGNPINYLKENFKKFYNNKIVFHSMWHCIILSIYTTFVQYPLSFKEIDSFVKTNGTSTIDNFCDNKITNLILLGAITNGSYLIGSITYKIFITKTKPLTFYKWWYPVAIILLFSTTTLLWFKIPNILILILISISQIIPYYLTYYDYYLFTEKCNEEYYGFILGLYGTSSTIITSVVQLLYLTDISFTIILIISGVLLFVSFIYSYYLANIFKKNEYALLINN